MLSTDVPLSSTKIAIVVVTLDTTPTLPAGDEKNFYDIFMSKNISKAMHRLSKTNWGGGGDITVGFIKLNHATFPFQISLTKAFVVNVLSLFASSLFGNKSGEFPGRFPQLVVEIEVVSWWWQKKSWIPNRLDRHHRLCVLMVFSNFRIRETICHLYTCHDYYSTCHSCLLTYWKV